LGEALLFVEEDLGLSPFVLDEVAATVGQGEVAVGALFDELILLAQQPVPVRVARVDRLAALRPDCARKVRVVARESLRDPRVGGGPDYRVLRCPTELAEGRLKAGDLLSRASRPDLQQMPDLSIGREQRRAYPLLGLVLGGDAILALARSGVRRRRLGLGSSGVQRSQTEDPRSHPHELALVTVALDVDGNHRVQRRGRWLRRRGSETPR